MQTRFRTAARLDTTSAGRAGRSEVGEAAEQLWAHRAVWPNPARFGHSDDRLTTTLDIAQESVRYPSREYPRVDRRDHRQLR